MLNRFGWQRGCVIASNVVAAQFHNPLRCTTKPALRGMSFSSERGGEGGGGWGGVVAENCGDHK